MRRMPTVQAGMPGAVYLLRRGRNETGRSRRSPKDRVVAKHGLVRSHKRFNAREEDLCSFGFHHFASF